MTPNERGRPQIEDGPNGHASGVDPHTITVPSNETSATAPAPDGRHESELESIRRTNANLPPAAEPEWEVEPFGDARDEYVKNRLAGIDDPDILYTSSERTIPRLPDGFTMTDVANADRLVDAAGDTIRYVHAWGSWLYWDETRWKPDPKNALVTEEAKVVGRRMARQFPLIMVSAERTEFLKALQRAESAAGISAALSLTRGHPDIIVDHLDLDADPWILNVDNGTIDLRTSELRPHDPKDMLTKRAPVAFDPDATSPLWDAAVERWFPEPELARYAQKLAGYSITGTTGAEILVLPYGLGANGKTKFIEAITRLLGDDYATVADKSLLIESKHEEHRTVYAALFGIRLAHSGELDIRARLSEASVKNLTGGDTISARRMREDLWTFTPTHTFWLATNHLPAVAGIDEGIWRRIRVLPFTVTIPVADRDVDFGDKLTAERPGILNWLLTGTRMYLDEGLDEPQIARQATAAYRESQDTFGRFLDATGITFDRRLWIATAELKERWDEWAAETGERKWSSQTYSDRLRSNGAEPEQRNNRRGWRGLGMPTPLDENQ